MNEKEAYQQKLEAKLDEWMAEIDKLKAKADQASAEAKVEYDKQVNGLHVKQEAAKEKLNALRQAGDDSWEKLKVDIEQTWSDLSEAVKTASSKLK